MTASADAYIKLSEKVVEYLRSRYHVEVPHISAISYDHRLLRMLGAFRPMPTLVEVGEEEERQLEEGLLELGDPSKIRGHSTHGATALFRLSAGEAEIKIMTSFYIRTAPPAEFRKIVLTGSVKIEKKTGRKAICVQMAVLDESGATVYYDKNICTECLQQSCNTIACIGLEEIACRAAEKVKKALYSLYSGPSIIRFTDDKAVQMLSTDPATRSEQIFNIQAVPPEAESRSDQFTAVQNLLYEVSYSNKEGSTAEVSFILRYVGPVLAERIKASPHLTRDSKIKGRTEKIAIAVPLYAYIDDRRNRWSVHHLIEVESELTWSGAEPLWSWEKEANGVVHSGLHGLEPIGGLAIENGNRAIIRDWHIAVETLHQLKKSSRSLKDSFEYAYREIVRYLRSSEVKFDKDALSKAMNAVCQAVSTAFPHIIHLYEYQEQALIEGVKALIANKHKVFVLQTRTAGGKTLSFLMPLLVYLTYTKLLTRASGEEKLGVKALLFYPTTALQNDQASIIFSTLWHLNQQLGCRGIAISMGLLHSYVPKRSGENWRDKEIGKEMRLRCPLCGSRLVIEWSLDISGKFYQEDLQCSNKDCKLNIDQGLHFLLNKMVKATRDVVYSEPPDILIATPDIINARLTLSGGEDPAALTILGKPAYVCSICGAVRDTVGKPRKCERCGGADFQLLIPDHPKVVVIDEAHLFRGAFGAQASHVITRIEQAVRRIKSLPRDWRPVYFISSATLNNPEERAVELVATDRTNVAKFSSNFEQGAGAQPTHRIHVFVMPKVFSPQATASRIIEAIYLKPTALYYGNSASNSLVKELEELKQHVFGHVTPATIVFANRIAEVNELLNLVKWFAHNARADGHTTDYTSERAMVEDRFSRGELDVIVATRGLEVGVDFDRVNIGMIYGMPYYLTDYVQRIGRIGRRQNSIIFNVFMPDKPIDYFYFKNWRLLCDSRLRELHIQSEAYRISRDNIEALRRSAVRSLLDAISIAQGAGQMLRSKVDNSISQFVNQTKAVICNYVADALGLNMMLSITSSADISKVANELCTELIRILKDVDQNLSTYRTLGDALEKSLLFDLSSIRVIRDLDQEVKYIYPVVQDSRTRELAYAVRHALPGQVISYRGLFFIIQSISKSASYERS